MKTTCLRKVQQGFLALALLILFSMFNNQAVMAQPPGFFWAKQFSGKWSEWGQAIATDRLGNILVAGTFYNEIRLGEIQLIGAGANEVFIAKLDPNGQVLWAVRGGGVRYFDEGFGVTTDRFNNVIVTGRFDGKAIFEGVTLELTGKIGFFLVKYNPAGQLLWAKQTAGEGYAVAADYDGNIYVTGGQLGEVLVARYDPAGNLIWRKSGKAESTSFGTAIVADRSGDILVTGLFSGKRLSFDELTLTGGIFNTMFLLKYSATGQLMYARSADNVYSAGIGIDAQYNSYVTGWFWDSTRFGNLKLTTKQMNMFVVKYNSAGDALWAKQAETNGAIFARRIATDGAGNSVVTGDFTEGTVALGKANFKGPGMFVAQYDAFGNVLWVKPVSGGSFFMGLGVAIDSTGRAFVTGRFDQAADFGGAGYLRTVGTDAFVAALLDHHCIPLPEDRALGYIRGVDHAHVKEICYSFLGRPGDVNFCYQAFDVDTPSEIDVLLNGVKIHDEKATSDSSWSADRNLLLKDAWVHDSGLNEIRFVNVENSAHGAKKYWGVRNTGLSSCTPLSYSGIALGYLQNGDANHADKVQFNFFAPPGNFRLIYEIYDVDTANEINLLLNGVKVRDEAITRNNAWSEKRELLLPDSLVHDFGRNVLTFDNTKNPEAEWVWIWGVRNVAISCSDGAVTKPLAATSKKPQAYRLLPNMPNPFNPATKIPFELPVTGNVKLLIYDLRGELVKTLVDGELPAGRHDVTFEATALATGTYFCRLESGDFTATRKMILAK